MSFEHVQVMHYNIYFIAVSRTCSVIDYYQFYFNDDSNKYFDEVIIDAKAFVISITLF